MTTNTAMKQTAVAYHSVSNITRPKHLGSPPDSDNYCSACHSYTTGARHRRTSLIRELDVGQFVVFFTRSPTA